MCRGNRKRDVTTMVTYSHATTPLGQSERAYYLSYFINTYAMILLAIYSHQKPSRLGKQISAEYKQEPVNGGF